MPGFLAAVLLMTSSLADGEDALEARARALHREILVVDTHVDTPTYALEHPDWKLGERGVDNHVDLPRLVEAGVDAPFMVVYTPGELEPREAMLHVLRLFDLVHGWVQEHGDRLVLARSPVEVLSARESGRIAIVPCMENGSAILPGRLDLLRTYHRLGARYLSLAHFRTNHLCDSATDEPVHDGVSAFGRRVLEECNRLGIMLDVSHISDDAVRDHLRYSRAPIIASHSNARAVCNHPRNLPDDLLREIASRGGVIQLNFAAQYVSADYLKRHAAWRSELGPLEERLREEHAGNPGRVRAAIEELRRGRPRPARPPLEDWFEQLDHVVRTVGEDAVGLGSDFDGIGAAPEGVDDVGSLLAVTRGLLARGWDEERLRKFYGGNLLRCWRQVEMVGEELRR